MKEAQFQTKLLKELRNYGWFYKASDMYRAGIPDLVGCINGQMVVLELKIDSNSPTPLQKFELECVAAEGGYALVVTYKNKTRTTEIGTHKFDSIKEAAEWISKQSRLHTSWIASKS